MALTHQHPNTTPRNAVTPNGAASRRMAAPIGTPRPALGVHSGQIVVAELAGVLLLVSATAGVGWLVLAALAAAAVLLGAFVRIRRRWLYEWLALLVGYASRRRVLPAGGRPAALLQFLHPGAAVRTVEIDGMPVGVIEDTDGTAVVVEVGDSAALLAEAGPLVPSPITLLPPAVADQPAVRLQLLVSGVAAPGPRVVSGAAATSYRHLTDGRIPAYRRTMLVVRVRRTRGYADAELHRVLASAVRRVCRRLAHDRLGWRLLGADSLLLVLTEMAHHDGAHPVRESWPGLRAGGLYQVCFRLRRWPDPRNELSQALLGRLLTLPGCAIAASLTAERDPAGEVDADLTIRLAAPSQSALASATGAARRLIAAAGAAAVRLDGAHLAGLAATLPLGGGAPARSRAGATELANLRLAVEYVGSSRVDLQACKLEYSIVSPK